MSKVLPRIMAALSNSVSGEVVAKRLHEADAAKEAARLEKIEASRRDMGLVGQLLNKGALS